MKVKQMVAKRFDSTYGGTSSYRQSKSDFAEPLQRVTPAPKQINEKSRFLRNRGHRSRPLRDPIDSKTC